MSQSDILLLNTIRSLSSLKKKRATEIIKLIMMNGDLNRSEIADMLGLAIPSVIKYTQMLVNARVLHQYTQNNGRQLTFGLSQKLGYVMAVIIGRTIQVRVVNVHGEIAYTSHRKEFVSNISPEGFMESIDTVIRETMTKISDLSIYEKDIFSIGVAIGGSIDPKTGVSYNYYSSKQWKDFFITEAVAKAYNKFTFIMNDVNAATLGEKSFGLGKEFDDFLLIWLGEGTGMGLIINGELYEGHSFSAGEIAHTKVAGAPGLCYCGNRGCLETLTTGENICSEYMELMNKLYLPSHGNGIGAVPHEDRIEYDALVDMANSGNKLAQLSFEKAINALVDKIADITLVLNPQSIIFRGNVIDGNGFMFERMSYLLEQRLLNPVKDAVKYIYTEKRNQNNAIASGLAAAAVLKLIED